MQKKKRIESLLPQEKAGENPCFRQRTDSIHARLALSAGVQTMRAESAWRGLTHMRSMCVGVAETGHRG